MRIKFILFGLASVALFFSGGGNLAADIGPDTPNSSNVGNTAGLGVTILTQAVLTATTSDGQDVSGGLTVPVGQPMPTVTFSISGPGVAPAGSWLIVLVPGGNNLVTSSRSAGTPLDSYGIAPGLAILGGFPLYSYRDGPVPSAPPVETELLNASVAQLGGTPTQTGIFDITLVACESSGLQGASTEYFDYIMRVTAAPATSFTTQPASQSVAVGQSVTFAAAAAGSPTYQWSGPNGVISGATGASLTLTNVQLAAAGAYSVAATVAGGSVTSNSATLTVLPLAAPAFTLNPVSVTVASGRSAVFDAAASGEPAPTYQWSLNGVPINGATDPVLRVPGATSANAGAYTCTASNSSGSATSTAGGLAVSVTSNPGYLLNLSARANVGTGNNILIGGFATGGTGTKQLLIRGVGPALSAFFGSSALATPQLTLLDGSGAVISTNLGWGAAPSAGPSAGADLPVAASLTLMNNTGAYPYQAGSLDTATLVTAPTGNGTAQVSGVGGAAGIGLVEFYDADTTTPTSRLVNISARAMVETGNNILIGGFAIGGGTAETVLIRAVGPGLNDLLPSIFPLSSVLNEPVLTIFQGGTVVASNTGWGGDATIAGLFPTVGAFSLNAAHQDSALVLSLPPGNYTAEVSGLNGGTGIALVEIYEVP